MNVTEHLKNALTKRKKSLIQAGERNRHGVHDQMPEPFSQDSPIADSFSKSGFIPCMIPLSGHGRRCRKSENYSQKNNR
jgi:hypothetical protein